MDKTIKLKITKNIEMNMITKLFKWICYEFFFKQIDQILSRRMKEK